MTYRHLLLPVYTLLIFATGLSAQPSWLPTNTLKVASITILDEERLSYKENEKYGLMDPSGKKITPPAQKGWQSMGEGLYSFQDPATDQWGIANSAGQVIVGPKYTRIEQFREGYALVQRRYVSNSVWNYENNLVDKTGKEILPKFYPHLSGVSEGLCAYRQDSLYGFITPQGQVAIKPAFRVAKDFNGGLAVATHPGTNLNGYIDKTGKWVIQPQFALAESFDGAFARVGKYEVVDRSAGPRQFWGLINRKGELALPMQYNYIQAPMKNGFRLATDNKLYRFVKPDGKLLNQNAYDYAGEFSPEGLAAFKKGGAYGFVNMAGQEAIPPQYQDTYAFSEGLAAVKKDGKWGFINTSGQVVIPFQLWGANSFKQGLAPVDINGEGCLIDKKGTVVLRTGAGFLFTTRTKTHLLAMIGKRTLLLDQKGNLVRYLPYDEIGNFADGLAPVKSGGKWGFINTEGQEVIPLKYAGATNFAEGLAAVQENANSRTVIINKTGLKVFEMPDYYQFIGPFSEGLAKVAAFNQGGYIDATGKLIVENIYANLGDFKNGMAVVVNAQGKRGFIDKSGKVIVPLQYDDSGDFSKEGLAPVKQNNLWGFVNKTGQMVIAPQYEVVSGFNNGVCGVKKGGKVGYIDPQNKEVVPLMFEDGKPFLDDYAAVKLNGKWGFANLRGRGKLVIDAVYEQVGKFSENLAFVKQNGKVGAINRNGIVTVPFQYDDAGEFNGGIAYVKKNGRLGIVDSFGKEVIPPVCNLIGNYQNGRIVVVMESKDYVVKVLPGM